MSALDSVAGFQRVDSRVEKAMREFYARAAAICVMHLNDPLSRSFDCSQTIAEAFRANQNSRQIIKRIRQLH